MVQTAWDNDWEDTGTGNVKNIAYAAARVSAFLNWVRYGSATGGAGLYGSGGMCVQGTSAGGGGTAFALAWYGAGSYIDKVSFLSSPPLSDIEQGCEVLPGISSVVYVCPSGQLGCNSANAVSNWAVAPGYTDALSNMRTWSDDTTLGASGVCRNATVYNTSSTANAEWKAMSIADGSVGTFNLPNTNMTAWLCANVQGSDGNNGVMNNSSPEGELFFQNFTSSSQTAGLLINAVTACVGTEGVAEDGATPPGNYKAPYNTGRTAIEYDMLDDTNHLCKPYHP